MQLFDFPPYVRLIYIPLCLYLYGLPACTYRQGGGFTFHYVYIYIVTELKGDEIQPDLHSTMFIFILF